MGIEVARAPVSAVIGVGPGNGAAIVRRLAREGYAVAMLARTMRTMEALAAELPMARPYPADVADVEAVGAALRQAADELGPVDVLVYNAGKMVWGSAEEVSLADFETAWRVNTLGALAAARAVVPAMKARGAGRIILIGATASLRGGAATAAFASAKAAQRSLAQSLARGLGPSGIHVSLVIVDGVVDEPVARARLPDNPASFFIAPDAIADTVAMLIRQPPSAWTFELDVRPFAERW